MYCRPEAIAKTIDITDSDFVHKIRNVLRLGIDDEFYIFDGRGKEWLFRIINISKRRLSVSQIALVRSQATPGVNIVLAFPVVKESIVDFILQKCTELGAGTFIPFVCEHSLKHTLSTKKNVRWNKIIIEACRQSARLWLPSIEEVVDFSEVLKSDFECKIVASIQGSSFADSFGNNIKKILIAVGPEGDFTQEEYRRLFEHNFFCLRLSDNILRTETAAIVAVGLLAQRFS